MIGTHRLEAGATSYFEEIRTTGIGLEGISRRILGVLSD